ncbi:unnamed protein product [Clavelina lepadiformis]|uniref:Uncharacterized protein n=1 Tax=Clavelina lepadiformis TaxID=159417 RepID=A0ABP0GB64_CLALP
MTNAPKDRLLVYNVKEGWGPLCKFLGKEIPNKEFPHENKGATIIGKLMKTHPATLRMQREMLFILSALASLGAFGTFKLYKSGHWRLCLHGIFMLKNIFKELFSFGV